MCSKYKRAKDAKQRAISCEQWCRMRRYGSVSGMVGYTLFAFMARRQGDEGGRPETCWLQRHRRKLL